MVKRDSYIGLLMMLCIVSLFLFLGQSLFNTRGEPREAIVAYSMLEKGNWILPVNNGVDMAYKPPLFHWCIASISWIAGGVTEYTSRMPSALALAAMVMVGYVFFAKRRGKELALMMAVITLTNFEVHRAGTHGRVDMLLSALIVIALYQLYQWGENRLRGIPWIGILCLSGAFLTKGPVGMVLPCLVTAVFLWIRGMNFWKIFCSFLGIALAACIPPLMWYFAAYRQGGDEFLQLVLEENVLRFLGKMSYESHINPAYYNVITVVAGFVPYTLLLLLSLFVLKYKRIQGKPLDWWKRFKLYIKNMDDARLFSLLSIVLIFVFYCIPKSKRSVYLLPIYPFIAYFVAEYILYLVRVHPTVVRVFGKIVASLSLLVLAVFFVLRMGWIPETLFSGRHAAENQAMMHALSTNPLSAVSWILLGLMLASAVYCFAAKRKKDGRKLYFSVFGVIFIIFLALDGLFNPTILNVKSNKPVAERIASFVPSGELYFYSPNQVEGNPMRPFTINFYLGDRIVPFDAFLPEEGYLIAGNADIDEFRVSYPDYTVREVYDSHHRSCDDHKVIHLYQFSKNKYER